MHGNGNGDGQVSTNLLFVVETQFTQLKLKENYLIAELTQCGKRIEKQVGLSWASVQTETVRLQS